MCHHYDCQTRVLEGPACVHPNSVGRAASLYQNLVENKDVQEQCNTLSILEDLIYRIVMLPYRTMYQLYIPESLRSPLLTAFHQDPLAGHLGRYKTYRRMQNLVYWPKMSWDVKQHVTKCQTCQLYKPESRKPTGKVQQTMVCRPWEMLGLDLMSFSQKFDRKPLSTGICRLLHKMGGAFSFMKSNV